MKKETHRKHNVNLTRICPKCGNTDGVIVFAGLGAKFFFCPICSPKKPYEDKKLELALEEK